MELPREHKFLADEPPCCLRISPQNSKIIFLGTYTLHEGTNRSGSIEIWSIQDKPEKLASLETHGAVLDLKISPFDRNLVATAHSTGNISLWKINDDGTMLAHVKDNQIFPEPEGSDETLITSLNFSPNDNNLICFTTTTGSVGLFNLETLETQLFDTEHTLEAWFADFYNKDIIFSGGDDMNLIAHDRRAPMPVFKTNRVHDAGIVSIFNPGTESTIWTGGYDDQLCVLDLRMGVSDSGDYWGMPPLVKEKLNLGGGVWRLLPSTVEGDTRIASCNMYSGGRILDHKEGKNVQVTNEFKMDHESITYGADWVNDQLVTCSFYDKVVQVWQT